MRNKINELIKFVILIFFILLLLVSWEIFIEKDAFAANTTPTKSTAKGTGASPATDNNSPINSAETNRLSYPSIFDLLSNQVDGDEVYVRYEDLLSYPSIFCSAKGTALPGYASTVVSSGGKTADMTDQGQSTGTLTMRNQGSATVFKTGSPYTTSTSNPYSTTTSKTYGRFKLVEVRNATPAEAWVLNEMNLNDPKISSINFEITDNEYVGEVNDENKIITASNEELWSVEWDSSSLEPTKYVTKKDGKYYYVTTDGYAPYTYVQHAWWKVKTVGTSNKSGVKDTDLAYEAEAFEDYIARISTNGENWQYNEDGTIKVDYTNYIAEDGNKKTIGYDSSKVDVRFNSETNKYVVGPFTINYLRAGIKQGAREKVSFSGISKSTLTGTDAAGKQLLDSDGNSVLQLGKNYKFVYDHNHEDYIPEITVYNDGNSEKVKLDTEEDYPYPYDGEEFYIEIDYLDDLANIESLDFDFQYMNAGASYEYLKGTYLIITWSPWYNSRPAFSTGSGSNPQGDGNGFLVNNSLKVAMGISARGEGDSAEGSKIETEEIINLDSNSFEEDKKDGNFTFDKTDEKIKIKATIPAVPKDDSEIINYYYNGEVTYELSVANSYRVKETKYKMPDEVKLIYNQGDGDVTINAKVNDGKIEVEIPRRYKAPIQDLKVKVKYSYKTTSKEYDYYNDTGETRSVGTESNSTTPDKEFSGEYWYENDILEEVQLNESDYTYLKGDTIYLRKLGVVNDYELGTNLIAKLKEGKIEKGYIEWMITNTSSTALGENVTLNYDRPQDSEYYVQVSVYSNEYPDIIVQQCTFKVMFEKMYIKYTDDITLKGTDTKKLSITNESSARTYYIFNAYQYITTASVSGIPDNQNPIVVETDKSDLDGGILQLAAAPNNVELIEHTGHLWWKKENVTPQQYLTQSMVYSYSDALGKEVTIAVEATVYSTNAYKDHIEDEIDEYLDDRHLYKLSELKNLLSRAQKYGVDRSKISQLEEAIRQKEEEKISEEQERKEQKEAQEKAAEEAKKKAEEEGQKQKAAEEAEKNKKKEQEEAQQAKEKAEEESKQKEEAAKKKEEEAKKTQQEEAKKQAEEAKKQAEEAKKKAEEAKKQAEEAKKQAEEAKKKAEEAKKKAEEAKKKAEETQKRLEKTQNDNSEENTGTENQLEEGVSAEGNQTDIANGLQSNGARQYQYYLRFTNASEQVAQDQINGRESTKKNVDAQNGRGKDAAGPGIHMQIIPTPINLRTSLSGMVWIDHDEQKDDATAGKLGVYDEGKNTADELAADNSVEVVVWKVKYEVSSGKELEREKAIAWDEQGNVIDFTKNRIYIKDGKYTIPEIQVPAEEGLDGTKYVISYDVEFIYDGQTYEATEYLVPSTGEDKDTVSDKLAAFKKTADETKGPEKDYTAYANSSYIVENADERYDFDKYFTEVYGDKEITEDGVTEGKATGGKGGSQYNYVELGDQTEKEAELQYKATIEDEKKAKSKLVTNDADGYVLPQYRFAARTSEAKLLLPYERLYHVEKNYYDNLTFQANQYKPIDEYFHQINLGLLEREEADVSVIKDLYTANVVVNEHLSTYHYNKLGQLTDEALTLQETLGYRKQKYTIDLYNSDYYYRSSAYASIEDTITKELVQAIKDGTELQLFLTYRIQFTNEADNMNASINEFKDYYDSSFTLITNEMCANKDDKTEYSEVGNDDGQFQKYITSIKAAGSNETEEVSREAKNVAYSPYYRKLTYLSDPTATSTSTTETPDPAKTDYYWNRDEDIDKSKVNKVETSAKNLTVTQGKDEGGYHTFTYSGLTPVDSIKNGKLPSSDPLVLEPNETIEFYVSFQVDLEGYIAATKQTPSDAQSSDIRADKLTGEKSNIVEITNYSSGYNYISNEQKARHTTVSYSNDNISGRIDQDSAPDNMNVQKINEFKYTEDDNEYAPTVQVAVEAINDSRKLDGTVWEDSRANNDVGDGIYDVENESGIGNIDVTMVEKIRVTEQDLKSKGYNLEDIDSALVGSIVDNEFEYVWKTETKEDGTKIQQIPGFDAQTTSSNEEGKEGYYSFTNFPTGTFVIRFEYGNDVNSTDLKYNGQDYKNTTYQKGMTNPTESGDNVPTNSSDITYLAGKSTLNNEWHDLSSNQNAKDLEEKRVSDARDYEPQRMRVIAYSRTLTNENAETLASANLANITTKEDDTNKYKVDEHLTNEYKELLKTRQQEFVDNTRMVANTAKLYIDVENQNSIAYKTIATTEGNSSNSETGATTDHEYYIKNIDFGLVERPETRINIQKEISKIQLLKNDGQEVILSVECDEDGNIIKVGGSSEDTVRVEKVTEINKESLSGQGFKYIAMESKFLKGLQVKLTYKITLENNSECDYLGSTISNTKNAKVIYDLADNYENRDTERLYSNGIDSNSVPFISGKGIIYGKYLGSYYYTNDYEEKDAINAKYSAKSSDESSYDRYDSLSIVTTTVDQLVDYIDNDLSISIEDTSNYENQVWVNSTDSDRANKLSAIAYEANEAGNYLKTETQLQDDKGRAYVVKNGDTTTANNISFSANTLIVDEPITVSYGKIALAKNSETGEESKTQAATAVVSDEPVGKLDTTEAESSGTNNVVTEGAPGKKLKFLTYKTQKVDLGYIYTLKTGNVGNANDVYNTKLTSQLVPKSYTPKAGEEGTMSSTSIKIVTTAQANEEAINNMNYDNLVEIAMYSNTAGRRDMQAIPGNANMIAKDYKAYEAGYKKNYSDDTWYANEVTYTSGTGTEAATYTVRTERDAYAARDTVTFSEPTGLSLTRQRINTIIRIILIGLIIAAFATIGVTVTIVLKKTKYDDRNILNS